MTLDNSSLGTSMHMSMEFFMTRTDHFASLQVIEDTRQVICNKERRFLSWESSR